jgi:chaperone required for assembly of F1-ATPase
MRDIFTEIFENQPLDPTEAARRNMRPNLRKRFYERAHVGDDFSVQLDSRPVKTPARKMLAAPNRVLAEAIACEWNEQKDVIDPATMPLTRLANVAIDAVDAAQKEVCAEIEKYLGSDLLFYRAESPEALIARQAQAFDPVLAWAADVLGARFMLGQGVMHVVQPRAAIAAVARHIPSDAWRLAAVSSVTTLTGSGLLALALAQRQIEPGAVWAAAHVDEDWQMDQWGKDEIALQRRAFHFAEFNAAATVLAALRK